VWALLRFLVGAVIVLLSLLLVGVAAFALYSRFASKTAKSERPWENLEDAETAKRKPIKSPEPSIATGEPNSEIGLKEKPPHTAWEDSTYCWVVVCKNHWVHRRHNLFHVHRIPLGETDAVTSRPKINRTFFVRCDDCRKEYAYKPSEVLRYEQDVPESFTPHPLFREEN